MMIETYKHGRVPKSVREKQILDIAEKQFIELGYEETTIESIRKEAGLSRPMIYDYFGSKDKVYLACVKRVRIEYENKIFEIFNEKISLNDLVFKISVLYFDIISQNPKRWETFFAGSIIPNIGELGKSLKELQKGTIKHVINLMSHHYPDINKEKLDAFSHLISAVGIQLGYWWLDNPHVSKEKIIDYNISFIIGGLSELSIDK
ncbi:TetR/AcrR family transcriptional regulator [Acinetobacter baumannii]|nr:TetR/AcrR family transcriptional regulator [Acinetobacter baumannii]